MCNFMGFRVNRTLFIKLKDVEKKVGTAAALEILKDGFKYDTSAVLRKKGPDDFELVNMHWEFIPVWIKSMEQVAAARKQGIPWLNATCEKLLESKMFRDAALKRRCLVLASHFYEWRGFKPAGEKKDKKYPYVISLKDREYFYMAGIWQPFVDKETGETMDTFAIVTTKANPLMEEIHNSKKRQPTILTDELAWEWLMNDLSEERIKEIASFQMPPGYFAAHTIPKDFKLLEDPTTAFEYAELPSLTTTV